ncbi:MAG: thioredoxin domain-containing protein [Ignavibacteriae bacterium]|nr:thioredoxin domain-containing protein [Ignavibacteriota bacterium]
MTKKNKKFENQLIWEKSPYLLQHSHNPVNWFGWNESAFNKAENENKPIFLSIGYSTCHWCHVMERESFEDEEVANLMNDVFVSIKVDREERPDIDNLYMSVCQMITGHGGWPLTIIMTPEKKPFYAGTYLPKNSFGNRVGMIDLVKRVGEIWKNQKQEINDSADKITSYINSEHNINLTDFTNPQILDTAFLEFQKKFDNDFGGFGDRPKFASPHNLLFLLRYFRKTKNDDAKYMVEKTLIEMRKGGIFDHLGFGFHRYSTDRKWFLPHFEKMIYDQAMLIIAYAETFQLTKNDFFKKTAEEIITYIFRDMKSPEDGFYSAEDADSEGEEGKFYTWTKNEILKILGDQNGEKFSQIFNVKENGNYYEESTGELINKNILFTNEIADNNNIDNYRTKLFLFRESRIHPFKDDKILTDWNGLTIAALAIAGRIFDNKKIIDTAEKSVQFILKNLISKDGDLLHRYRDGDSSIDAKIDDYAFFIWGLLELYESTNKTFYLEKSIELTGKLISGFWDTENNSGFFFTDENSELIVRTKEFYDGAVPSGNSVMFSNLIKLFHITGNQKYKEFAELLNKTYKSSVEKVPISFGYFLSGLIFQLNNTKEILLVGEKENPLTKQMLKIINEDFNPNKVVICLDKSDPYYDKLLQTAEYLKNYKMINEKTTAYICENFECNLPVNNIDDFIKLFNKS